MVDADVLDEVVDVVDEVLDGRARRPGRRALMAIIRRSNCCALLGVSASSPALRRPRLRRHHGQRQSPVPAGRRRSDGHPTPRHGAPALATARRLQARAAVHRPPPLRHRRRAAGRLRVRHHAPAAIPNS